MGGYLSILFWGESIYINNVKNKSYTLLKVCLKIKPELVEINLDDGNNGAFDLGILTGDIVLLDILKPYITKFNFEFRGERTLDYCAMREGFVSLEYALKNDLIRTKAEFTGTYQNYINFLMSITSDPLSITSHLTCGNILIEYGADPFFYESGIVADIAYPIIIRFPEYLNDCYRKDGIKALFKFDKLIKEKTYFQKDYSRLANDLKGTGIKVESDAWKNDFLPEEIINRILKVLASFEKNTIPNEDLNLIKEIKRYIVEVESKHIIQSPNN